MIAEKTKDWRGDDMKITRKLSKQISLCKISMNFVSRELLIY